MFYYQFWLPVGAAFIESLVSVSDILSISESSSNMAAKASKSHLSSDSSILIVDQDTGKWRSTQVSIESVYKRSYDTIITGLHTQKAYTHSGTSSSQFAYNKSADAYTSIHFVKSFCCLLMHLCILPENCNCIYFWVPNCNSHAKCIYA